MRFDPNIHKVEMKVPKLGDLIVTGSGELVKAVLPAYNLYPVVVDTFVTDFPWALRCMKANPMEEYAYDDIIKVRWTGKLEYSSGTGKWEDVKTLGIYAINALTWRKVTTVYNDLEYRVAALEKRMNDHSHSIL